MSLKLFNVNAFTDDFNSVNKFIVAFKLLFYRNSKSLGSLVIVTIRGNYKYHVLT